MWTQSLISVELLLKFPGKFWKTNIIVQVVIINTQSKTLRINQLFCPRIELNEFDNSFWNLDSTHFRFVIFIDRIEMALDILAEWNHKHKSSRFHGNAKCSHIQQIQERYIFRCYCDCIAEWIVQIEWKPMRMTFIENRRTIIDFNSESFRLNFMLTKRETAIQTH